MAWNVGDMIPNSEVTDCVQRLLLKSPDFFAFSVEEMEREKLASIEGVPEVFEKWHQILLQSTEEKYELISCKECGCVGVFLFRKRCSKAVVKSKSTSFNFLAEPGYIPKNKASVAITFDVEFNGVTKSITIIGNHLQAYDEEYEKRNEQFLKANALSSSDYTIMMGDLNYRIEMTYEEVLPLAIAEKSSELIKKDQLKRAQREIKELGEYKEAEIKFRPTYKYDENSDNYDTSEKHRVPSFTDRILIKTKEGNPIPVFNEYNRMESKFSDHRPVYLHTSIDF
jgi:hypothetical protein